MSRVFAFMGKTSSRKICFLVQREKRLPDLTKKIIIIISITFKEKNEREEGAMKAKHDERERGRERSRKKELRG